MKLVILALDYDGTIGDDSGLHEDVRQSLVEARGVGVVVVLVTGRILSDLARHMKDFDLFDAIVAENGAVLHFPRTGRSTLLAPVPDARFVEELARRGLPCVAGECVVELDALHASAVLAVVRELELPLILAFNRARLMVLPQGVSKGTGLREAARALRVSLHNALAIGDAENDHELLRACEHGVAVAWGSPALAVTADSVLSGRGPSAVAGLVRRSLAAARVPPARLGRHALHLGARADGTPVSLAVLGRNVLIAGDAKSGKSWLAGLLCEQLVLQRYCVCVVDPEGDYATLEALPGVIVLAADGDPPSLDTIERTLRFADVTVVVDLGGLPHERKLEYVPVLLGRLAALRRRTGLPHRVVLDESHYFLRGPEAERLLDCDSFGHVLVTYRVSELNPCVLRSAGAVLISRESSRAEADVLRAHFGRDWRAEEWAKVLAGLQTDEATLLAGARGTGADLVRFRVARRLTPHVRHQHKYLSAPASPEHAFVFRRKGRDTGRRAYSLQGLIEVLSAAPEHVFDEHLRHGDFSRWIADVFSDPVLTEDIRRIETGWRDGTMDRPHDQIVRMILRRYGRLESSPIEEMEELRASDGFAHEAEIAS